MKKPEWDVYFFFFVAVSWEADKIDAWSIDEQIDAQFHPQNQLQEEWEYCGN